MMRVPGVQDVHDLHVWCIANNMYALSCHASIADLPPSESAPILHSLETILSERYRIGHTAIQFESHAHQADCCSMDGLYCQMECGGEREPSYSHTDDHPHKHMHVTVGKPGAANQEGA